LPLNEGENFGGGHEVQAVGMAHAESQFSETWFNAVRWLISEKYNSPALASEAIQNATIA